MKRAGPVLLLGLVLGATYLLINSGSLSSIMGPGLKNGNFTIKYITFYTGCQHEAVTEESRPRKSRNGLLESLSKEGWIITSYVTDRAELQKEETDLCLRCREKEFVGIYGNVIGVYAGSPETPGPLKQVIPVNIRQLPPAEIKDLEEGIVCNETQDKWQILEGFQN